LRHLSQPAGHQSGGTGLSCLDDHAGCVIALNWTLGWIDRWINGNEARPGD
jgi:hypothetical protein